MSRTYKCPRCREETDPGAAVCSNAACRAELAFCSQCRDVSTYRLVREEHGRFARSVFACDRCERAGVKCRSWLLGGYCNGLARRIDERSHQFCARCSDSILGIGKNVATAAIIGGVGGLLRRRK